MQNMLMLVFYLIIKDLLFVPGVYILIGAGSLVMLVGFFGCCGAVRESQCLLGSVSTNVYEHKSKKLNSNAPVSFTSTVYINCVLLFQFFACLLIIFGAEVAAGVFGFLNKDKVHLLFHSWSS